ncbi:MAG: potassium transporter Kup [Methylophilaceae bacterium]
MSPQQPTKKQTAILSLAALGVVFGDIGTSPLYSIREIFSIGNNILELNILNMLGVLSMIFWSLIAVVSIKYITFIMRANNNGEGGIMALLALAHRNAKTKRKRMLIAMIGIMGACMFYADGMITPAISVLSAIEGIEIALPGFHNFVIPITLIIIFFLFWFQSKGTASVGFLFGPVMLVWFSTLAVLGIINIINEPSVLKALNPYYAYLYLHNNFAIAFITMGAIILCVTGAESLYADMGHFGRAPIRITWFSFVFPALTLNYYGQGALILQNPENIINPFYLMSPEWFTVPLIFLATIATIIASQACITGAFSVSRQALQLGFIPRMRVDHTSENQEGQIYLPRVNFLLMVGVIAVVLIFQKSSNLAAAYGVAITMDMVIASLLSIIVFAEIWKTWTKTIVVFSIFLVIDLVFFAANIIKVPNGGWFPLLIGIILLILMTTWSKGRSILYNKLKNESMHIDDFIKSFKRSSIARVKGISVFMTPNSNGVPHALLHNLKHNKVMHEKVVILTVKFLDIPHVKQKNMLNIVKLPNNFYQATVNYGFSDEPNIPRELSKSTIRGLKFEPMATSYFIGKESLVITKDQNMGVIRKRIFSFLFNSSEEITNQFKLPVNRVVELGSQNNF